MAPRVGAARKPTGGKVGVRKKTAPEPEIESTNVPLEELSPEADALERIQEFLGDGSDTPDIQALVYLVTPQLGGRAPREEWIFDQDVMDLAGLRPKLASEWGSGQFRVRIMVNGRNRKQYDIFIKVNPRLGSNAPQPPATPRPAAASDSLTTDPTLLALLDRMDRRLGQLEQGGRTDPIDGFAKMATAIGSIMGLMPKAPPAIDIELFTKGIDMATKMMDRGGGGDDESSLSGMVRSALNSPILADFVKRMTPAPPAPVAIAMPAPAAPAPLTPQPAALAPGVPAVANPQLVTVDQAREYLIGQARAGVQPSLVTSWCREHIPDQVFAMLEDQEKPVDFLIGMWPEAAGFRPWFEALIETFYLPEEEGAQPEA